MNLLIACTCLSISLLTPQSEPSEEGSVPWVAFYKPNATIAMVDHFQAYSREAVPQQVRAGQHAAVGVRLLLLLLLLLFGRVGAACVEGLRVTCLGQL